MPEIDARRRCEAVRSAVAFALPVLLILPFANKAYHIDDPLTIWTAQQIAADPLHFFDFDLNWYGATRPASTIIKNPPLFMYVLAPIGALTDWSESAAHVVAGFFAGLLGLAAYRVARRFCDRPLLAAALAVLSPAVLVSASNVMTTLPMVALYVLAIEAWLHGLDTTRHRWFAISAALIAASTLTKYFGISAIPLLLVYTIARERRFVWRLVWLGVPVLAVALYEFLTRSLFGVGLFSDAGRYAQHFQVTGSQPLIRIGVEGLAFFGGALIAPFFFTPLLGRRWAAFTAVCGLMSGAIVFWAWEPVVSARHFGSLAPLPGSVHFAVFIATGLLIGALAVRDLVTERTPEAWLLALWVGGTFVFATMLNWSVNARSFMPAAVPVGILIVRALARGNRPRHAAREIGAASALAALSLALVYADFTLANSARDAARYFADRHRASSEGQLWIQGHWGWQYYMEEAGAKHIEYTGSMVHGGDTIVAAQNNMFGFTIPEGVCETIETVTWTVWPWWTVWNSQDDGAFYSNAWGPLPYVFGRVTPETYIAYHVDRTAVIRGPGVSQSAQESQ